MYLKDSSTNKRLSWKYLLLLFVFIFSGAVHNYGLYQSVQAQDSTSTNNCHEEFVSGNNIQFWDPCSSTPSTCSAGGSLLGPGPSQLSGETNTDKVWNYFLSRGLSPVAAAGVMGNIEQESSFNPFAQEKGGTGIGLIQWSFDRRNKMLSAASQAGVTIVGGTDNDAALLFQLNYLWDGEYGKMTWQEKVNAETTVDGIASIPYSQDNSGNGSTMVFHSIVEKSGDGTKGKQERIDSAKSFLEKYGNGGASGLDCGQISEGGLTYDQAIEFMKRYGENVNGFSAKMSAGFWNMCNGHGSNCVTFSYFFNKTFTDLPAAPGDGNGFKIVSSLRGKGADGGLEPKVFSTFSWSKGEYGHTGIVLGIHGDEIIVGHASCSSRGAGKGDGTINGGGSGFVLRGKLSDNKAFWGTKPTGFAYPKKVDTDKINQFISKGYVNE